MPHSIPFHLNTQNLQSPRWSGVILQCLLLILIFLIVLSIHLQQTGNMSPQSKANLAAASKPALRMVVAEYPKCWPPAYPVSLYVFSKVGMPVHLFNVLCFFGALSFIWFFARAYYSQVSPSIPILFVALVHGNYYNLHQQTAEALFLFFATASLLILARFKYHPSWFLAFSLGLLTAGAVLTRFFALFWIVPIVSMHVTVFSSGRSWWRRVTHGVSYIAPLVLFVLPWLFFLHSHTGSFSGMDRSAPRRFPSEIAYWADLTGLGTNVKFVLKTTFIDFFSPEHTATHAVVNKDGITESEIFVLVALITLLILALTGFIQILRNLFGAGRWRMWAASIEAPQSFPAQFAAGYVAAIVAVWTVSNNDPIYTRFLFPSYPFVLLTIFAAFIWLRKHAQSSFFLAPWYLGACLFTAMNLINIGGGLTFSWSPFL